MTRRSRLIHRRLPLEQNIYNRAVTFLYGSPDEINAALRKEIGRDFEGRELRSMNLGKWLAYEHDGLEADFICLVRRRDRSHEPVTLAHECLHHTAHALRMAGVAFNEETEEAYTYYLAWIMSQCLGAMP